MTLATRCPSCGTTFRVVSDQLKLRKGLVKCGRCSTVFNGVEKLHYIADEVAKTQPAGVEASGAAAGIAVAPPAPAPVPVPAAVPTPAAPLTVTPPPAPAVQAPPMVSRSEPLVDPLLAPLRPDLPRFVEPRPSPPPTFADSTMNAVEPDHSIDLPRDDQPLRSFGRADREPWPEIKTDLLDRRGRAPSYPLPPPSPFAAPAPVASPPVATASAAPPPVEPIVVAPVPATPPPPATDHEDDVEHFVAGASGVHEHDPLFDDVIDLDKPLPSDPVVVDEPAPAPVSARAARATNLRNIFESGHGVDDLAEVDVETAGVLPHQARAPEREEDLGPLTLLDVAGDRHDVPEFLQEPRRASRGARIAVGFACLLAFIAALAQGAYLYRAELATSYPVTRPALVSMCELISSDCTVGLPRRISALRVVSAELQATPQSGEHRYLLRFGIGNESSRVQTWPYLELMLTDVQNKQVVRRVITPDEYLGAGKSASEMRARTASGVAANAEESLTVPVRVDIADPVYGYALGIFHP